MMVILKVIGKMEEYKHEQSSSIGSFSLEYVL